MLYRAFLSKFDGLGFRHLSLPLPRTLIVSQVVNSSRLLVIGGFYAFSRVFGTICNMVCYVRGDNYASAKKKLFVAITPIVLTKPSRPPAIRLLKKIKTMTRLAFCAIYWVLGITNVFDRIFFY